MRAHFRDRPPVLGWAAAAHVQREPRLVGLDGRGMKQSYLKAGGGVCLRVDFKNKTKGSAGNKNKNKIIK